MNRIAFLAAAAALIALPASAESIRISTVGKSPEQVRNEVYKAAHRLCSRETFGASFSLATAMRAVNAIPAVCRAKPGLVSSLDLALTLPVHGFS